MGLVWHLRAASPGIRGVFSLLWTGARHRQPCPRPHDVIPSLVGRSILVVFGLLRCPADLNSTTASRACAKTTQWGSGTPGRFPRCDEPCESRPAYSSICAQVTEGTRDHSSNHNSDFAVCLYCFLDAVTCGALKPNDMWYYSIKYDDGEEEHKVGPARIFPDK